jgi:hypothetical protein
VGESKATLKPGWAAFSHRVADVDGVDRALCLEVVEGQLEANSRVGLVAVAPSILVELRRVLSVVVVVRRGGEGEGERERGRTAKDCSFSMMKPMYSQPRLQDC